jgi:hypothetical protein
MVRKNNILNWSNKLFIQTKKKRNIIGFNISAIYKFAGRVISIDGLCLSRRGKNSGLVSSSIEVRRKVGTSFLFTKFFIFIGSAFKFKITGYSFKNKKINFSKISYVRYK